MAELTVQVSEKLKAFLDAEVAAGASTSVSDFVRGLIRDAKKRKARERASVRRQEGLNSDDPIVVLGSPQLVLAAMQAEPHLRKEDVDDLDRAIQEGKRPASYRNPLAKPRGRKRK